MSFIIWMAQRTFRLITTRLTLYVSDRDGAYEAPATVETALRTARKRLSELDDNFHFHTLRHTYTTNLLSNGAAPKDVQELLGHSDVSTTMNVTYMLTEKVSETQPDDSIRWLENKIE